MPKEQSCNWKKSDELPFLEEGYHNGFPFTEGFPESLTGTFEIVTAWGERLAKVKILPGGDRDSHRWDAKRSKLSYLTRISRTRILDESMVAGWNRTSGK